MRLVRVLSRGEIVIPKEVRNGLGWSPGDVVALQVRGNELVLSAVRFGSVEEASRTEVGLTREESTLLRATDGVPASIDALCERSGLGIQVVMAALVRLEVEGLVTCTPYGYVRATPERTVVVTRRERA